MLDLLKLFITLVGISSAAGEFDRSALSGSAGRKKEKFGSFDQLSDNFKNTRDRKSTRLTPVTQ